MFKPVSNKLLFPQMEEEILRYWAENDTFKKSIANRKGAKDYVFYDGPPFATGAPHYGHLLAGTIKDILPRYQTMRGYSVERRFGWDCHGLPIEALAQEQLGLSGAADIAATGVDVFNETCRSMVLTYVEEWRKTVTRMGRWVDFDSDYKTMDISFMESIWWVFKQLWDQGRIYKSHRIMPYSWKLNTPLSNFEAGSNYQDVQDPSITVRVKLTTLPPELDPQGAPVYALIWTTTPWTLYGNLAICAGPDIPYVAVRDKADHHIYLLAEARLSSYYPTPEHYERLATWTGADLCGLTYEPIFPTFEGTDNAFRILNDGFVSTDDGTGFVHTAPAFGEDDFRICRAAGIPLRDYLDDVCAFTASVPDYHGIFCKDADKAIIRSLKDAGKLVHQSTLVHSYPFCPRTDTPLIYRAIEAWYVRVEDLRDKLVANNATVHWVPQAVGEKRFGNWLKEAKDWNISRNRYWGSCLPIWISEDGQDMVCVGSIAELEQLSGQTVTDLHKHHLDKITFDLNGKTYHRTPEVLDCWFESGAMPYAQQHYPFARADELDTFFPADFIAEGLDQTRGWFYTLMLLGTALFDRSPYKNVIVNGLVLAEDGRKMSKRLKNYPDPNHILGTYGADALRLYMIHSPIVRAEDLCFSEQGVVHALRHLLIPWWNAYSFFVTYANVDGWSPSSDGGPSSAADASLMDRWIFSTLDRLSGDVVAAMDAYDLQQAVRPLVQFIDDLTNWYIRRSRRRFWKSEDDADKTRAYETLHTVLLRLCQIAAPFTPFIAEEIFRNLRTADMPESVHLCDYPLPGSLPRDPALEAQMGRVQDVVGLARQLRADFNLKVRQPLAALHVVSRDPAVLDLVRPLAELVADELNIKEVRFGSDETALAELSAKANYKTLGPRLGRTIKKAVEAIAAFGTTELAQLLDNQDVVITLDDAPVSLTPADVLIQRTPKEGLAVASSGDLLVALETTLTPALIEEGHARELINRIQNQRKAQDLDVADRITLTITADAELVAAITTHRDTITAETLAVELTTAEGTGDIEINGHLCTIDIERA